MDDDRNAPATKGDVKDLREEIRQLKQDGEQLHSEMQHQYEQLHSEMQHQYDDLKETLRDSETKLLKAFYAFAESNQKRVASIESENASIRSRLATVEDRLTELEKRLNFPPAA